MGVKPGGRKGGKIPLCDEEAKKDSIAGKIRRHLLRTILSIVCEPLRVLGGGGGLPFPDAALIVMTKELNNSLQTTEYDYGMRNLVANNHLSSVPISLFSPCDWYINLDHLYRVRKIQ